MIYLLTHLANLCTECQIYEASEPSFIIIVLQYIKKKKKFKSFVMKQIWK